MAGASQFEISLPSGPRHRNGKVPLAGKSLNRSCAREFGCGRQRCAFIYPSTIRSAEHPPRSAPRSGLATSPSGSFPQNQRVNGVAAGSRLWKARCAVPFETPVSRWIVAPGSAGPQSWKHPRRLLAVSVPAQARIACISRPGWFTDGTYLTTLREGTDSSAGRLFPGES